MVNIPKSHCFNYAPLYLFLTTYIVTDLIGALLLLFNTPYVAELYMFFSGTQLPVFTSQQFAINLCLLLIAPFLLCVGYYLSTNFFWRRAYQGATTGASNDANLTTVITASIFFFLLFGSALFALSQTDCFSLINTWFSYSDWIFARWLLLQEINFFTFVNIYTLIPLAATWLTLVWKPTHWFGKIVRWMPIVLSIGINSLLYQKRSILIAELIPLISWGIYFGITGAPKSAVKKLIFGGSLLLFSTYYLTLSLTQLSPQQATFAQAIAKSPVAAKVIHRLNAASNTSKFFLMTEKKNLVTDPKTSKTLSKTAKPQHVALNNSWPALTYSVLAPLTRTAAPALYYPVIFPSQHAFYKLRHIPDDNVVVWHYMNPHLPGTSAAPFQFVWFSQLGLLGTLALVFVTGILLGCIWKMVTKHLIPPIWASLLGSMMFLFVIYLAVDSIYAATLFSYGTLWGGLFILSAWLLTHTLQKIIGYYPQSHL